MNVLNYDTSLKERKCGVKAFINTIQDKISMIKAILLAVSVLMILFYFNRINRLNLSILFGLFWVIQIIICLIFLPEVEWKYGGLFWIILVIIFFTLGFYTKTAYSKKSVYISDDKKVNINRKRARLVLWSCLLIGFIYVSRLVVRYGFSLQNFMSLSSLLDMNSTVAVMRYAGETTGRSGLDTFFLIVIYLGPMVGGYCFNFFEGKEKSLSLLTLLPELFVLLTENTKAGMISCSIFWAVSFLVGYIRKYRQMKQITGKTFFLLVAIFLALLFLLMFTMLLRIGEINEWSLRVVKNKIMNYLFGHIVAFDLWFSDNMLTMDYTFGSMTFLGISKYFGAQRVAGVYQQGMGSGGISSNVFTYFRGIISDFGVIGGLVLFFLLGILIKFLYDKIVTSSYNTYFCEATLIMILSFLIFFIISIFTYTSYICAFMILPFIFKFIYGKSKFIIKIK